MRIRGGKESTDEYFIASTSACQHSFGIAFSATTYRPEVTAVSGLVSLPVPDLRGGRTRVGT